MDVIRPILRVLDRLKYVNAVAAPFFLVWLISDVYKSSGIVAQGVLGLLIGAYTLGSIFSLEFEKIRNQQAKFKVNNLKERLKRTETSLIEGKGASYKFRQKELQELNQYIDEILDELDD